MVLASFISSSITAQDLSFYIPGEIKNMNSSIPTPRDYLGFEIGQQYVNYDQAVSYLRLLAQKSDRIKIVENGFTHEKKPLIFLIISLEKNLSNIEKIRENLGMKPAV